VQFQVLERYIREVVALEGGQEFESIIAASNCFAFFAGTVAVYFWQMNSIVYLVDLLFSIRWSGHLDVVVEFRTLLSEVLTWS